MQTISGQLYSVLKRAYMLTEELTTVKLTQMNFRQSWLVAVYVVGDG